MDMADFVEVLVQAIYPESQRSKNPNQDDDDDPAGKGMGCEEEGEEQQDEEAENNEEQEKRTAAKSHARPAKTHAFSEKTRKAPDEEDSGDDCMILSEAASPDAGRRLQLASAIARVKALIAAQFFARPCAAFRGFSRPLYPITPLGLMKRRPVKRPRRPMCPLPAQALN